MDEGSHPPGADSELLRAYFDSVSSGVFVYDEAGRLVDINETACRLHGRSRNDMLARDPREFIAPESHAVFEDFRRAAAAGEVFRGEARGLRADGSRIDAEVEGRLIVVGGARYLFSSVIDVTERNLLAAQLRHAQRTEALGQLAGGIAHDFNNLLSVIIGFSEFARAEAGDGTLAEDLDAVIDAGYKARDLVQHLLAFSRRQALEIADVDLCALLDEQITVLRRLFPEDIRIERRLPAEPCVVRADRTQLVQILLNLCINAQQAMPDGGELHVELEPRRIDASSGEAPDGLAPGHYFALRVRDSGRGMDADTLARIFDPFFTTKERGLGTGLGLAMVHGCVHQHGGRVDVRSSPGRGAEFVVLLPCSNAAPATVARARADRPRGRQERVLVVEDSDEVRAYVRRLLEGLDYRVVAVASADEALAAAAAEAPDLALIDLVLSDAGGPEVLERLRAIQPGLGAVFMSGHAEDEVMRRAGEMRDVRLLPKPLDVDTVAGVLRDVLDARGDARW
jgi:PAS domain S-box-containing protein